MPSFSLILLIAALVCFIAAFFGWGRGVPAGLACLVGAQLVGRL